MDLRQTAISAGTQVATKDHHQTHLHGCHNTLTFQREGKPVRKLRRLPWRLPKPQSATPLAASTAAVPDEHVPPAPGDDDYGNRVHPEYTNGERRRTREPVLARYPRRAVSRNSSPYQQRDRDRELERERAEEPGQPVAYSGGRYVYGHASTHEPMRRGDTRGVRPRAHDDETVTPATPPNT
jgi:hypothetical protein